MVSTPERDLAAAPALYETTVTHVRTAPLRNAFSYPGYHWLVDIDDLPRLPWPLRPLARFPVRDHCGDACGALRANVDAFLRAHGIEPNGGRVLMLAHARVLGHVFNPITVYWCYRADGSLACVIAEVHNTYRQRHRYLVRPDTRGRAQARKEFYVSPFNAVDGVYRLSLPEPGRELALTVTLHRPGTAPFVASLRGRRRPATPASLLRLALRHPLTPLAGAARIRLQGVKLFLRGLPIVPRPAPVTAPPGEHPVPREEQTGTPAMTATTPTTRTTPPIDPGRWPDVARVPRAGARSRVARLLAERAFARTPIRVTTPDGPPAAAGGSAPRMRLHRPDALYRRLSRDGLIGFGESYMAGDWDSPELVSLLTVLAEGYEELVPRPLQPLRHLALPTRPRAERNTRSGARHNVSHHYDLSNELFALFLDETMSYSAALFDGEHEPDRAALAAAQHRKIDRLLDGAGVTEGTRLLEIGTGWGELAIRAAHRGAEVTSITLSREQRDLARARAARAGASGSVDIRLCDYREITGRFDAVVSVEMIERSANATGRCSAPPWTASSVQGAASACRPSAWSTGSCGLHGTASPGCTSMSSPAV